MSIMYKLTKGKKNLTVHAYCSFSISNAYNFLKCNLRTMQYYNMQGKGITLQSISANSASDAPLI